MPIGHIPLWKLIAASWPIGGKRLPGPESKLERDKITNQEIGAFISGLPERPVLRTFHGGRDDKVPLSTIRKLLSDVPSYEYYCVNYCPLKKARARAWLAVAGIWPTVET